MRLASLTTAVTLALAAAACSDKSATDNQGAAAADSAADAALRNADAAVSNGMSYMPDDSAGFANAVASSDLYEIESSTLAATKAAAQEVKDIAVRIRTEHQKSTADLKIAAAQANVAVVPALDIAKQGMLDQLKAANGAEFDRLFVEQQKTAHSKALGVLQNYGQTGDNATLKDFAAKGATMVQGHIDHLNRLQQK